MEVEEEKAAFPFWKASRRKLPPDSPFFAAGNVERELLAKQVSLEITKEEKHHICQIEEEQCWETVCPVVGCKVKLRGLEDLEAHYAARHTAICSVCSRVFPTGRLLSLHLSEVHDSFFKAKIARGYPMFECLVEGCGASFQSDSSRHQHLVDKHKFPSSFQFHKKRHLSQRQRQHLCVRQMLKPDPENSGPRQAVKNKEMYNEQGCQREREKSNVQMEVDVLTSAVSRLTTADQVPPVVSFGRRHNRGFAFLPRKSRGGRSHPQKQYRAVDNSRSSPSKAT